MTGRTLSVFLMLSVAFIGPIILMAYGAWINWKYDRLPEETKVQMARDRIAATVAEYKEHTN